MKRYRFIIVLAVLIAITNCFIQRLFAQTLSGYHPGSLHLNSEMPKVTITSFDIFNKPADDPLPNKELKLEHDKNFFSFLFAAFNFSNSGEVTFAYKLDGIDKDWVQDGNKNSAT